MSGWWYAVKYARGRALSRASRDARARDRVASVRPCRSRVWGVGGSLSRVSLARDSRVATLSPLHSRGSSRSTSILDERRPRADAPRATARPAPRRDQPGAPAGRGRGAPRPHTREHRSSPTAETHVRHDLRCVYQYTSYDLRFRVRLVIRIPQSKTLWLGALAHTQQSAAPMEPRPPRPAAPAPRRARVRVHARTHTLRCRHSHTMSMSRRYRADRQTNKTTLNLLVLSRSTTGGGLLSSPVVALYSLQRNTILPACMPACRGARSGSPSHELCGRGLQSGSPSHEPCGRGLRSGSPSHEPCG